MKDDNNHLEKAGLLGLAALSIGILAVIAFLAIDSGKISSDVATLVGVIATGLIAFGKDVLQAVRGYGMAAQLGKVTDQLAESKPAKDDTQKVEVMNDPLETQDVNGKR